MSDLVPLDPYRVKALELANNSSVRRFPFGSWIERKLTTPS